VFESLIDTVTPWFHEWGLVIVFVATFVESSFVIASIFPGESVLLLGGFFASPNALKNAPEPPVELLPVMAVAFAGAVLGDIVGYIVGRVAGRAIVRRFGRYFFLPERRLPVLERYFVRYGGRAVLLGRFAPFLRSVRTLVAGIARMPFPRFVLPDAVGAAMWSASIAATGFLLGESWRVANRYFGAGGFVVLVLLLGLFVLTWRGVRARLERELAEQGSLPPQVPPVVPPAR